MYLVVCEEQHIVQTEDNHDGLGNKNIALSKAMGAGGRAGHKGYKRINKTDSTQKEKIKWEGPQRKNHFCFTF